MKKIGLLAIAILTGATAFAQQSVLKEAERAMKDKAGIDKVVSIITPAFTNPETENSRRPTTFPAKPLMISLTSSSSSRLLTNSLRMA